MTEKLFGTNPCYADSGDFAQRYFYQLRGCVPPPSKSGAEKAIQPVINKPHQKSKYEIAMDKARAKVNRRYKG